MKLRIKADELKQFKNLDKKTILPRNLHNIFLKTLYALCIVCIISIIYTLYFHIKEEIAINNFIKQQNLEWIVNEKTKASAFVVSDTLRAYFNVNQSTWKNLSLKHRPFFRNSVLELLKYREGACGEGARVLVRTLMKLGFNATRVGLNFAHSIAEGHVVVSIIIDGKEYYIDTISSSEEVNEILRNHDINSECFKVKYYKDKFNFKNPLDTTHIGDGCRFICKKYHIYSYEAIPLTKIANLFFGNAVVRVFDRPGIIVSYIAESYYLIYVIIFSVVTLLLGLLIWILRAKVRTSSLKNGPDIT